MKFAFIVYHDVLDQRISNILSEIKIDYYTQWEEVKGKGHLTDAHLGTRPFPGYNFVRMIAFDEESKLQLLIEKLMEFNKSVERKDDQIRLFQLPLEKII
jgi:hypothetical protein